LEIEESKIMKMTQISAPIQNVQNSISGVSGQLLAEIIKLIGGNVGNAGKQDKSPIVFNFENHYHQ
jgi:hypothetical protein